MNYKTFIFENFEFDEKHKILLLNYSFDNILKFQERIEFLSDKKLNDSELVILYKIFKYLHIICGISYYKLFLPFNIKINTFDLSKKEADFFNIFYLKGLGELAYKNNIIDIKKRIKFPYKDNINNLSSDFQLKNKKIIAIGGGKDSIVTLNILKNYYKNNLELASINTAISIEKTIEKSGLNSFSPKRIISQNLLELNSNPNIFNGHVPISGILAFIFLASSIIYEFDTVFLSNERSANIGNLEFAGMEINHQWSKSFEFEKLFNNFCHTFILKNFNYISFLRPLSEIHIIKLFSQFEEYHSIFTSCNRAFKINDRIEHWCCNCDKCRFVFLILSNFLSKSKLLNIFKKNLFEDEMQLDGFLELCGLKGNKPFECVGEIEESVYAILNTHENFKNDFIVKKIIDKLENVDLKILNKKLFLLEVENHLLDDKLFGYLKEIIE